MISAFWRVVMQLPNGAFERLTDWMTFDQAEERLVDLLVDGKRNLSLENSQSEFCDVYGNALN